MNIQDSLKTAAKKLQNQQNIIVASGMTKSVTKCLPRKKESGVNFKIKGFDGFAK